MATPVTMPEVAERWWVALMSTPTETRPGRRRAGPSRPSRGSRPAPRRRRRAAGRRAGCCPRPASWRPPARGDLQELDPHLLVQGPHRHRGEELLDVHGLRLLGHRRHSCRRRRLLSVACGIESGTCLRLPQPTAPPAAARRTLPGLSRVLRAPGGELLDHDRPAHQRGLRLHLDAHQRAARRAADPPRGRLRRVPADVPAGGVLRLQGQPQQDARRVQQPAAADRGGARRAPHPLPQEGRLRGRRHHRAPWSPRRSPTTWTC